jgi:hypothetical protein
MAGPTMGWDSLLFIDSRTLCIKSQAVCRLIFKRLAIWDEETLFVAAAISKTIVKALRTPNLTLWNKVFAVGLSIWWHILQSQAWFDLRTVHFMWPHLTHLKPFCHFILAR